MPKCKSMIMCGTLAMSERDIMTKKKEKKVLSLFKDTLLLFIIIYIALLAYVEYCSTTKNNIVIIDIANIKKNMPSNDDCYTLDNHIKDNLDVTYT